MGSGVAKVPLTAGIAKCGAEGEKVVGGDECDWVCGVCVMDPRDEWV